MKDGNKLTYAMGVSWLIYSNNNFDMTCACYCQVQIQVSLNQKFEFEPDDDAYTSTNQVFFQKEFLKKRLFFADLWSAVNKRRVNIKSYK